MSNDEINMKDHDLLVTIANDSKWIKDWAMNHAKDDAVVASKIEAVAKSAHARVDKIDEKFNYIVISGILTIILFTLTLWFKK